LPSLEGAWLKERGPENRFGHKPKLFPAQPHSMKSMHKLTIRISLLAVSLLIMSAPCAAAPLALPLSQEPQETAPADPNATPGPKEKDVETPAAGAGALGSATISVDDGLDLVTASIFSGGIKVFGFAPNVLISSTLPAAKPEDGVSTKYQDVQLLTAHGGVLNLMLSWGSVDVVNASPLAKAATVAGGSPIGRQALADRRYVSPIDSILTDDKAALYFLNGIGARMLNRNADSTTGPKVSSYGVSGLAYLGLGVDGAFIPVRDPADQAKKNEAGGQYRIEVFGVGSWTDGATMKALYPTAPGARDFNAGVGANLQIVIAKKLGVNVQASWPLGSSRDYMGKILLVGITISR
jgi:hypothetical protein